jgi:hypothetical protein
MYDQVMLATEFRKHLFQTLEKAAHGAPVAIEYKGVTLRLEAVGGKSKLARAVRRNAIVGDPDLLTGPDLELLAWIGKKWEIEDSKL